MMKRKRSGLLARFRQTVELFDFREADMSTTGLRSPRTELIISGLLERCSQVAGQNNNVDVMGALTNSSPSQEAAAADADNRIGDFLF